MFLSTLQTVGILVGIIYYITIMRNQQRTRELSLRAQELTLKAQEQASETRQAQLFMNIYNQSFTSRQFLDALQRVINLQWKDFDEYLALFDYTNPETRENRLAMMTLTGFFEGVGVLVKEGLLDIRMVALLMTGPVKSYWEKIVPIVEKYRERDNYPRMVSETEYLYNELMKYISENPEFKV